MEWNGMEQNGFVYFIITLIIITNQANHMLQYSYTTIYVQIFETCKFQGCHKFSIFTILFLRITKYPPLQLMQVKGLPVKF